MTLLFAAFVVLMVLAAIGSRHRVYIGSAAGFWFFVALFIWAMFFIIGHHEIKGDTGGGWFLASFFSAPSILTALLAVLIRNMTRSDVPAWLITPPVFVLIGYIILSYLFFGGVSLRISGQLSVPTACASRHVIEVTGVRITEAGRLALTA